MNEYMINRIKRENEKWQNLLKHLRNNDPNITHLDPHDYLHGEHLLRDQKKKRIKELCEVLKQNRTVTSLNLRNCNLGTRNGEMVKELSDLLKKNHTITELNLASNQLFRYQDADKNFSEALLANTSITRLIISHNSVTDRNIKLLSASLMNNHTVNEVDLSYHNLTDEGVELLNKLQQTRSNLHLIGLDKLTGQPLTEKFKQASDGLDNDVSADMRSPQVTIKNEHSNPRHPLLLEEIKEAAIAIRGRSNAGSNCPKLSNCIIEFFRSGKIEIAGETPATGYEAGHNLSYAVVKTEPGFPPIRQAVRSSVGLHGLYKSMPPSSITVFRMNDNEDLIQEELIDLEQSQRNLPSCLYNQVNETLIKEAEKSGGVVFGQINIWRNLLPALGHEIAFYAIYTDTRREVFFIDAQHYDGITDSGYPVYSELTTKYEFVNQLQRTGRKIGESTFNDLCFYAIHGRVKLIYNVVTPFWQPSQSLPRTPTIPKRPQTTEELSIKKPRYNPK